MIKVNKNTFVKWIIVWMTTCGVVVFILFPFISISSLAYCIIINVLLIIWMSIVETLLQPELKSSYFNSHHIERKGKIYEYIGVHFFRKLLVLIGWERSRKKENPIKESLILLEYYEYRTRTSEFGHTIIAIIIFIISVYVCIKYSYKNILWLVFFNIFLNICPITIQRYNRPRVRRVIKKLKLKLKLKDSKIVYKNW